jgi:hypothetical protein
VPDAGAHPFVGELLFFDWAAVDPRFNDPGAWFTCTGTLVSPTVVVTPATARSAPARTGSREPG